MLVKNSGAFQYTHEAMEIQTFSHFPGGSTQWYNPLGRDYQYLPKLYMHVFFVPAFSLLGMYPTDISPKSKTKQN